MTALHDPSPVDPSGADLVEAIQLGRSEFEAVLYERYSARVYYIALRGSKSPHDAEDVRAETFLRVLQAVRGRQVRSATSLPAFILGVTRNVLNELYARRRRTDDGMTSEQAASAPSHEAWFLDREVRHAIRQTIGTLKPRDRSVLRMHFYEELPTEEVARRLGIAPERVRLVRSRALARFRALHQRLARAIRNDR